MNLPNILGSMSIMALSVGVGHVLNRILVTKQAERLFLPELKKNGQLLEEMSDFISSSERHESQVLGIAQSLAELTARSSSLTFFQKQALLAALRQPSLKGRSAYIGKLIEAVGPELQPTRRLSRI